MGFTSFDPAILAFSRSLLSAGLRHDEAVVAAASDRDQAFLNAVDGMLSSSGSGTGLQLSAAEALPIRQAVARLRGVVGASTTVASSAVTATASFLQSLSDHGTALSHALNSADGTFFGQIVAAETAALSEAFGMRADYERAIVQADHDYALALAASSAGPLADLADALGQHKRAAFDDLVAVESPRFASLEHWPFTIGGELQDVFLDRYTLNIDGLLDAIAAWDAAHPVVIDPPALAEIPLDLGLPAVAPEWMSLFEDAFSGFPAAGGTGGEGGTGGGGGEGGTGGGANSGAAAPNLPDWLARLDALVTRGAVNIPGFDLPPSEPSSGNSVAPNPPPTVSSVEWDGFTHVQSGVYI